MSATDTHAKYGGSNASRWIGCPGSTREIARAAVREGPKPAADEGKAAHHICEIALKGDVTADKWAGWWVSANSELERSQRRPKAPGAWFLIDDEMIDGVNLYLETVRGHLRRLPGADLYIEQIVYPAPSLRRIMWGTADAMIVEPWGELVVEDFKYGRGVVVEPEYNDQGMFYGTGAMRVCGGPADVGKVTIGIVQPRASHPRGPVREWETTPQVLSGFSAQLEAAVEASAAPDAPLIPGPHCRFCPVELDCPALQKKMTSEIVSALPDLDSDLQVADVHMRFPDPNDGAALRRAMQLSKMMKSWQTRLKDMVYDAAQRNVNGLGFKLAPSLGNRVWTKEDESVIAELRALGLTDEQIFKKKVNSPAQIEKIKAVGKKWVASRVERPEGAPTLVPDTDPRVALDTVYDVLAAAD